MPLPFAGPLFTAGAGSTIPLQGGSATSGDAFSGGTKIAPINIGGLFGSDATSTPNFLVPLLIIGGVILAVTFLRRK